MFSRWPTHTLSSADSGRLSHSSGLNSFNESTSRKKVHFRKASVMSNKDG